jgi:TolB-like protein/class 3 adenylate cyclase/Flp pilus assembly protein TadD
LPLSSRSTARGLVTLVFTDLVDSTALLHQLGDQAGTTFLRRRRQILREVLHSLPEAEEIETAGDSFLLVFAKPSDAVRFALQSQARLRTFSLESGLKVQERMGIHLGEVVISEHETEVKAKDLYGIQLAACARVMSLAAGGQVLLTRGAFDSARQVLKGEDIPGVGALKWASHGVYLLKGIEEPVEVCEVAEAGGTELAAPKTSEKAQRQVRADEEPVLGWRPAVGQEVPNTRWVLEKKLGEGGFGEVWLGRHQHTKERRVFKFCFRADRARSLKREMTLFRLIKERIGDHPNIVAIREVYFEQPPYFLEEDYAAGADLASWCKSQGGAEKVPLAVKLEIVAQVAEALQAAHDAGVIHRDVKPANILVSEGRDGSTLPHRSEGVGGSQETTSPILKVKLTDFGIGQVVSQEYLAGVTKAGFTQTMLGSSSSQTGTQLYMAPELLAGKPASTQSDLYSLGVVLYQLVVGDLTRPMTIDWDKRVDDALLRQDLLGCLAGEPEDRFSRAAALAGQLQGYRKRQAEQARQRAEAAEEQRLARQSAVHRRKVGVGTCLVLAMMLVALGVLFWKQSAANNSSRAGSEPSRSKPAAVQPSTPLAVPAPDQKSVAVLAFANLSEDKANEYFSDGLSEELLNVLAKVPGLKVSARTSAFHFKGKDTPIPEIARQLDVAYVVEGSVRTSGNRVRITAQLIKAQDGFHVWSDSFDRELKDIFAVQDEIAGLIAHNLSLQMKVGAEGGPAVPHGGTENLEAYDLFLRGRQLWNKRTGQNLERAIGYFQQATEKDPKFAAAYAGLGLSYCLLPIYMDVPQSEAYPKARAAAQRALELDPRSAEAHTSLGLCSAGEDDAISAEAAYRQALVCNPNYATAHQWYGEFLAQRGRADQAWAEASLALALDPLSPVIHCDAGEALWYGRRYDEALLQIDKALQLSPDYLLAYVYRGQVKIMQQKYAEAFNALEKARALDSTRPDTPFLLGHCYGAVGRTNEARQVVEDLKAKATQGLPVAAATAFVYKGLGDREQVFAWLERAASNPVEGVRMLKFDPMWDDVTADPRFATLLKKRGLDK